MNTRDFSSDVLAQLLDELNITTNDTFPLEKMQVGAPNLSNNFGIITMVSGYLDGDYELILEESEDGIAGWTPIDTSKQQGVFPPIDGALLLPASIIGAFDTKQFVRGSLTSTNVTLGANLIFVGLYNRTVVPAQFLTP